MDALPVLDQLPPDYAIERTSSALAAVHESAQEALHDAGWSATRSPETSASALRGRKPLRELRAGGELLLVRRFTHGGLLRWATGTRFRDPERPFREILLSEHLHEAEIPTPRVVAARARRASAGVGWNLEILTRRVPGTSDLGIELARIQRGELTVSVRRALLRAFGAFVARLHGANFLHADLNPNNILVETDSLAGSSPRLWVLDLDRSRVGPLKPEERVRNIGRLFRHVDRREGERGRSLSRSDYLRWLAGYAAGRADRKELWNAVATAHRQRRGHKFGWLLERSLGGADPRAQASDPAAR